MAEFERFDDDATSCEWMLNDGRLLPADFTADEAETARWLNNHFNIAGEELPPLYAKTLLGDPRHAPASDDFEERTLAAVFGRLELERPVTSQAPLGAGASTAHKREWPHHARRLMQRVAQRGAVALMAAVMLLSYNAIGTGVALASVLQIVVGHGGTQAVRSYPKMIAATSKADSADSHKLEFMPVWPGDATHGYTFDRMEMIKGQWWTKGVMAAFRYTRSDSTGTHALTVLEFLPKAQLALQVVQDGSMSNVQIGSSWGVFVWGRWVHHLHQPITWEFSHRAEIVYGGQDGAMPVIWIAADDLGDLDVSQMQATLTDVAQSLRPIPFFYANMVSASKDENESDVARQLTQPFNNDIIELVPDRSSPNQPVIYERIGPTIPDN